MWLGGQLARTAALCKHHVRTTALRLGLPKAPRTCLPAPAAFSQTAGHWMLVERPLLPSRAHNAGFRSSSVISGVSNPRQFLLSKATDLTNWQLLRCPPPLLYRCVCRPPQVPHRDFLG